MRPKIGVDIGGTNVRAGLIVDGRLLKIAKHPMKKKTAKQALKSVVDCIQEVWQDNVVAIGVGCPGPLDYKNGVIISTPNLPWYRFDLKSHLEVEFRKPVIIDNDANCFTLAHDLQVPVWLGVTLGTGLGSAIVLDGVLFHGTLFAPELSEVPWNSKIFSTKVTEDIISKRGLLKLAKLNGVAVKTPLELFQLAKTSSKARKVFELFGEEFGRVLRVVHAIIDPEIVVLGGQISKSWKYFAPAMKKSLKKTHGFRSPKVIASRVKYAGVIGASMLIKGGNI